ncbi:helix-turn-helix domain-containing protein [Mycolicibacterium bacteremicum]|uniref:helix-turn-helix domain-containing protein n=1 Tax=Mycolicibacterium bacteremicum TaxID=564198 RepID=UPI0026EF43C2|nr:helix-turn-helix domain-containing protein [Mycolicibacterium bacteremicum]
MSDLPTLLTSKELAEVLGVSVDTLANERYLNIGVPYIKFGKRVRYRLDDVIAYLEKQRVQTGA